MAVCRIRMQDPLKQGLKRKYSEHWDNKQAIRMQDPLKQGLKQDMKLPEAKRQSIFECKIH